MKKLLLAILALSALPAPAAVDTGARDKISALEDRLAVLEETGSITNFVSVTNAVSLLKADAPSGNVDSLTNQTVLYFKPSIHTYLRLTNNGGEANLQIGLSTNVASFPLATNALFAGFGALDVGWLTFYGATNLLDTDGTNLLFGGIPVGIGSGFPLTNDVSFSNFSASAVGGLSFSGSTNVLSGDGTNLSYGGQSLSYEETDPVWSAEKSGYATGTPVYAETDPVWSAEKSGYATGTPVYAESDPLAFLADGSRPLAGDVSAAGFDLTGGGVFQATNGIFRNLYGNSRYATNLAGGTVYADLTANQDLIILGNLLVYGSATNFEWTTVEYRTNVYAGTNYIYEDVYRTNVTYAYQITYVVTNTTLYATNYYTTIVNVGGSADYSLAASVLLPHLSDGAATNPVATGHWDYSAASLALPQLLLSNGVATATGTWDFTGATLLGLPAQGVTNIGASLTGNGLETALDVNWGTATTTAMTNIDWASFGDGGATSMVNGTYDAGTRTLTATGYPTIAEMEAYVASNAVSATNEIPAALDDLADVDAAPADGDVLAWNSSASVWTNAAASGETVDGVFAPYQIPYAAEGVTLDPTNGWWQLLDIATGTSILSFAACSTGTAYSVRLDIIGTNALTWNVADPVVAPTIATEADGTTKVLFDSPIGSDAWGAKRIW